jgi:acetate kinase
MSLSLLALNVGSASLKAASYSLTHNTPASETGRTEADGATNAAVQAEESLGVATAQLPALGAPALIVHRIVHGGDRPTPLELTPTLLDELSALASWAPLHQPPALALARAAIRRWPKARHYGAFDTSWHLTMPEQYRLLPLPFALYAQGIRRYGFHGLAFQSAIRQLARQAPALAAGRIVLAHLGGGSSLCAAQDGRCVNTTMGMTPLGGVPMSTRSGSLDPGVILHLQRSLGMSPEVLDRMLWKESGLQGLSGESGDMRVLLASQSPHARRAIAVYVAGIVQGIAMMAASMGGIDALVFSGGIGLHAGSVRASIVDALGWMGVVIDEGLNQRSAAELSGPQSSVRTFALAVNEEFEMADAVAGRVD